MNSLEDAFINIAREEENLLADLKKHGVRTESQAVMQNEISYDSGKTG